MDAREARGVSSLKADQPRMNRRCTLRCNQHRSTSDTMLAGNTVSMCDLRDRGSETSQQQSTMRPVEQYNLDHVMQRFRGRPVGRVLQGPPAPRSTLLGFECVNTVRASQEQLAAA